MVSLPSILRDEEDEIISACEGVPEVQEDTPLLPNHGGVSAKWMPPAGFLWIEIGKERCHNPEYSFGLTIFTAIFANVFLSGFDGTITASTYAVIGSEFNAVNTISWLTTSYLITSTAFQPLYGRFSDILGRRLCFFTATTTFMVGCLGCGLAPDVVSLNLMRALTGLGGGGLITMATIINSDMIPFRERGMYQAAQNVLHGFGSICGASLGGVIADTIGWRWCFLCQVPVSIMALVIGHFVIANPNVQLHLVGNNGRDAQSFSVWKRIDLTGSIVLILGLSAQLAALSMGGNSYPWDDIRVILSLVASAILLAIFVTVEIRTTAIPVMPMKMLRGTLAISNLISNVGVGMAAYAVRFPHFPP